MCYLLYTFASTQSRPENPSSDPDFIMPPMGYPYADLKPQISMSSLYSDVKSSISAVQLPQIELPELNFPEIKFSELNLSDLTLSLPNIASSTFSKSSTAGSVHAPSLGKSKSSISLFSSSASTVTGSYCGSDCKVCGSQNFKPKPKSQWKRNLDPMYLRETYCPFEKARRRRDRRVAMKKYEREFSVVPWTPSSPIAEQDELR